MVTGRAGRVAELEGLRQEVIEKTGTEGFVTKDPSDNNNAREVFDQPQSSNLLAQAAPAAGDRSGQVDRRRCGLGQTGESRSIMPKKAG